MEEKLVPVMVTESPTAPLVSRNGDGGGGRAGQRQSRGVTEFGRRIGAGFCCWYQTRSGGGVVKLPAEVMPRAAQGRGRDGAEGDGVAG